MYCEKFGLSGPPFNNTPDPRFFFNTPDHDEALASLQYAAQQRKGFVLVTGEVGSGKTLLSRLLSARLPAAARTAIVTHTRLSGRELLLTICREFELDVEDDATSPQLTQRLQKFLIEQYAKDRLAIVILDEAQNLPLEAFEELRMLGNLEADDAKLLQVLILGQPELLGTFRRPELRQLHQRIFRAFHLPALNRALTGGYIAHRLTVAGLPHTSKVFDEAAIDTIFESSKGIPRLINQICDNALLSAYSAGATAISAERIRQSIAEMMSLEADSGRAPDAASPLPTRHYFADPTIAARMLETEKRVLQLTRRLDTMVVEQRQDGPSEQMHGSIARTIQQQQLDIASAHAEMLHLMQEARNFIQDKEAHIADLTSDEQATFQTARQLRVQADHLLAQASQSADEIRMILKDVQSRAKARVEEREIEVLSQKARQQMENTLHDVAQLRDQLAAECQHRRDEKNSFASETRAMLVEARQQAASLLAELRVHVEHNTTKAAKSWQHTVTDGATACEALEERIAVVRDQAQQARKELDPYLDRVQVVYSKITGEVGGLRQEIHERLDLARADLETLVLEHRRSLQDSFVQAEGRGRAEMDARRAEADRLLLSLKTDLQGAANEYDQMRAMHQAEVRSIRDVFSRAAADGRTALAESESRVQSISKLALAVLNELSQKLGAATDTARTDAAAIVGQLERSIENVRAQSDGIRKASQEFTAGIIHRLKETVTGTQEVLAQTESAVSDLRELRSSATTELRSVFAQMRERAEHDRVDLSELCEAIRSDGQQLFDQNRQLGSRITEEMRAIFTASRADDADQRHILTELAAAVDARSKDAHAAAERLVAQAQNASSALIERVSTVLDRASTEARDANEQAAAAMNDARAVQQQIQSARDIVRSVHAESLASLKDAAEIQCAAHTKSDEVLKQITAATQKLDGTIHSVHDAIQQSGHRATALTDLSQKTAIVVRALASARDLAVCEKQKLDSASNGAEKTMHLLKHHTQRVGQLVGIIRQLYGTMDARVERIRQKLDNADELCRAIPREIEALNDAFTTPSPQPAAKPTALPPISRPSGPRSLGPSVAPPVIPRPANVEPLAFAKGTLGEIVQRNRQLNAWLHDVLDGEQMGSGEASITTISRGEPTAKPRPVATTRRPSENP